MTSAARTARTISSVVSFFALAAGCGDGPTASSDEEASTTLGAASTSGDDGTAPPAETSSTPPDTSASTSSGGSEDETTSAMPDDETTSGTGDDPATSGTGDAASTGDDEASTGDPTGEAAFCGDGTVLPGEETCDDGNRESDDGCSADCQLEGCVVPMSHDTIQAGIDDLECSTIFVLAGTYNEQLTIERPVIIEGVGPAPVIVDPEGEGSAITVDNAGEVELRQLVVTGGHAEAGGGIVARATELLLDRTTVTQNTASIFGGGIAVRDSLLVLTESLVSENRTAYEGGSMFGGGAGIYAEESTIALAPGSAVADNVVSTTGETGMALCGGGICALQTDVYLAESSIRSNTIQTTKPTVNPLVIGAGLFIFEGELFAQGAVIRDNLIDVNGSGSGGSASGVGGGIAAVDGALTFEDGNVFANNEVRIRGDEAEASGGGLWLHDASTVLNSTLFEGNAVRATSNTASATATGAGLALESAGADPILSIVDSTFRGGIVEASGQEPSSAFGGGLFAQVEIPGGVLIDRSTFSANEVHGDEASGAGIFGFVEEDLGGDGVLLRNSTISGNAADGDDAAGGAVMATGGGVHIVNATITGNTTTTRGGAFSTESGGSIRLTHSIVYNNVAPDGPTCDGTLETEFESILGPDLTSCDVDMLDAITTDPGLSPLADNGGATFTHAIDELSAAYNASTSKCSSDSENVVEDQRGMERVGMCTLGAFEPQ